MDGRGSALIPFSIYTVNMVAVFLNAENSRISVRKQGKRDLGQPKRESG